MTRNPNLFRVLAHNKYEFGEFLHLFNVHHNNARHIQHADQLIGLPMGTPIFCVGDYTKVKEFSGIYNIMVKRELRPIEIRL